MGEADLTIAIGQPHEVLRQPPATIWRYRLRGCIVDLFLFRDLESDRLKSLSFAVAGSDAVSAGPQDPRCADAGRTKSDG